MLPRITPFLLVRTVVVCVLNCHARPSSLVPVKTGVVPLSVAVPREPDAASRLSDGMLGEKAFLSSAGSKAVSLASHDA
jgi:hypothetical protein